MDRSAVSQDYDVLVIGSGFGGSVAALRLAEKGYRVGVLEAGRRFEDADFPSTCWDVRRFLWAPKLGCLGIQRIHVLRNVITLAGAGVGGGSLAYANTLYQPTSDAFFLGAAEWRLEVDAGRRRAPSVLSPPCCALPGLTRELSGGGSIQLRGWRKGTRPVEEDERRRTSGLVGDLVQGFIAQLRGITDELEGLARFGEHRLAVPGGIPLPGALSAAQLTAIANGIAAQRRSIDALRAQLSSFDEQLAVLEKLLLPLAQWSSKWAELEAGLLNLGRGRKAEDRELDS